MKKIQPSDLFFILKNLRKKKIQCFDKRIPFILLILVYNFLWNIFYTAKMLTNFRGKTITKKKDIILACIFFAKKIERKTDKRFRKDFSKKIRNFECIIEPPSRRKKRNILKKRSLKTNNLRIV